MGDTWVTVALLSETTGPAERTSSNAKRQQLPAVNSIQNLFFRTEGEVKSLSDEEYVAG